LNKAGLNHENRESQPSQGINNKDNKGAKTRRTFALNLFCQLLN